MFASIIIQVDQSGKIYNKAWDWILNTGPKIIIAVIIFFIGEWIIRKLSRTIHHHVGKKNINKAVRSFLQNTIVAALHIILVLFIMQYIGIRLTIFAAVIAAFGAAAGLALSGTLQNFTSGLIILLLKPFELGDNIIAQNNEGTVTSIQAFFSVMKTFDNKTVIIPNSKLSNEVITNITREGKRRLDIEMKFNYSFEFENIRNIIKDAVQNANNVEAEPEVRVGISSLESDGFKILINIWVKAHGFRDTSLAINEKILQALKANNIKLPGM